MPRSISVPSGGISAVAATALLAIAAPPPAGAQGARGRAQPARAAVVPTVTHRTIDVGGLRIFYREAGPRGAPAVLLLHGFPSSSHMYRNLIPALADQYRVIAPDFPGFGRSSMPSREEFAYTFANLTRVTDRLVQALIVQNGNAYEEGLREFWAPLKRYWASGSKADRDSLRASFTLAATKWQYTHGVGDTTRVSPDAWELDHRYLERPGNHEIQLDLFYDYRTNVELYPAFQAFFRRHQPPTLIVWGKNDVIFPWQGAEPYRRDLNTLEYHLLDTGHFALEEKGAEIAGLIRGFLGRHVDPGHSRSATR